MTVLITLTTAGADSGPFDLYSNVDGYVSAFETGVSKAALVAGYSSSLVPNGTTTIRIKSIGVCTNYIDVTVVTTTTTTSSTSTTTTTTTTSIPCTCTLYDVYISGSDISNAINNTDTEKNGKVYVRYYACELGTVTLKSYDTVGLYADDICNDNSINPPQIFYYTNDIEVPAYNSYLTNTFVCCNPLPPP